MYQIKGKIDSTNALEFEKDIMTALPTEIDASQLEYISSAGLRVLMKLRKTVGDVTVINVSSEVYEIFDVTGFTSILTVKKALREISIEGKEILGQGGNGTVYRLDDETIVKVYRPDHPIDLIDRERAYAKTAFIAGVPSIIAFDMVKVGDSYGVVYEAMNSDTLGHAIMNEPERRDEYIMKYAQLAKTLHTTSIEDDTITSLKELLTERVNDPVWLEYCEQSEVDVLKDIVASIPEGNTLVHGDLHPGNIMINNGELMLIDMGEVTRGVPIYDAAAIYRDLFAMANGDPEMCRKSMGLEPEVSLEIGPKFFAMYSGITDPEQLKQYLQMMQLVFAFNSMMVLPVLPDKRWAPNLVNNLLRPVVIPNADTLKYILSK